MKYQVFIQPRSQGLFYAHRHAPHARCEKSLAQDGHVSPRFKMITKFIWEGGVDSFSSLA